MGSSPPPPRKTTLYDRIETTHEFSSLSHHIYRYINLYHPININKSKDDSFNLLECIYPLHNSQLELY